MGEIAKRSDGSRGGEFRKRSYLEDESRDLAQREMQEHAEAERRQKRAEFIRKRHSMRGTSAEG
jgi:hypothetical protein